MSNAKSKRRLEKLHKRDPHCHWCRKLTVFMRVHTKQTVRERATLDHLDDRFDPMRGKRPGEERTVLACWACNHTRAQARQAACVELQRHKSQAGHIYKAITQTLVAQQSEGAQ